MKQIRYDANPTAVEFHKSTADVRMLIGPVGSGKSVACCLEIFSKAKQQKEAEDGIRYSRWAITRNTYPELKSTTIKTWQAWYVPEIFGNPKFDSPITHHIKYEDVDLEVLFISLDSDNDVKKLLSLELTGVWINEAREVPKIILDMCTQRVGRYPKMSDGGATWYGVICDTNPPDDDHWIYKTFETEKHEGYEVFHQPSGLMKIDGKYFTNPEAENLPNLPADYYTRQTVGKTEEWIKVYLMGRYGTVQDGRAIYTSYNDRMHLWIDNISFNPNLPLGLGWDFGLTPAVTIGQLTQKGQFLVIDELHSDDMGLRQFVQNIVIPYLNRNYGGWQNGLISRCDPSGNARSQTDETTCMEILNHLGIKTEPARSNLHEKRKDAVNFFLNKLIDGEPAFQISPRCNRLRKGFLGQYQYSRIKTLQGKEERYQDRPLKNMYSHIMEACEYLAMEYAGTMPGTDKPKLPAFSLNTTIY